MTKRLRFLSTFKAKNLSVAPESLGLIAILYSSLYLMNPALASEAAESWQEAAPQQEVTTLEESKSVERDLAGGQFHQYEIALSAGQAVSVVVEQHGIDVAIDLLKPDGKLVAEFDLQKRLEGEEKAEFAADATATYRFKVRPVYGLAAPGRYQIRVAEIRAATEKDKALFEANKLMTEGEILDKAGKYDDAAKATARAVEIAEGALGANDPFVGHLCFELGLRLRSKGDYANADTDIQRAVDIERKAFGEEDPQTAQAVRAQGLMRVSHSDYAGALPYYQQALEIIERTLGRDDPQVALTLLDLSVAHTRRGDFETAISELERGRAIAEKTMGPEDSLTTRMEYNLGDAYLDLERYDQARVLMERVLAVFEKQLGPDHPNVAYPLQNLGIIARHNKQYDVALDYLWRSEKLREKALGPQHSLTATLLVNIGNVYHDEGAYAKAMEVFQRALDVLEPARGPYDPAIIMTLANMSRTAAALDNTASSLEYQSRLDQLVDKSASLNLAVGSEREKLDFVETIARYTERSISMSVQLDPADEKSAEGAATAVLRHKGRVLDALSDSLTALRRHLKPEDQKLLEDLSGATAELAKLALNGPKKTAPEEYQKQFHALEKKKEQLEAAVSERSAGYYQPASSVTLAAIKAAIPENAVLLEFAQYRPFNAKAPDSAAAYGAPRYVAYVIQKEGGIRYADLGEAAEVDSAVRSLREALGDPTRGDAAQLARALDEKIFQPLQGLIGGAQHLLVSPDGELNLIPFEALVDRDKKFLVERYAVSYLTTGRDLLRMRVARASQGAPVIIANPLFGEPSETLVASAGQPLPPSVNVRERHRSVTAAANLASVYFAPLPGTAAEARAIQAFFPEAKTLAGNQASKKAIEQVDAPRILHIATHGFFLQDPPAAASPGPSSSQAALDNPLLRSGLALSGANLTKDSSEDGILTSMEAAGLNLWGTKLVVLSACETGVGKVKNGEGVYGLRRAFLLAGTESLVMSLWEVSDQATHEMMSAYYSGLKKGLGRGEALRQAQLSMLKRKGREHPFYWASFIESGEWANLDGLR